MARELIIRGCVLNPDRKTYSIREYGVFLKNVIGYDEESSKYITNLTLKEDEDNNNFTFEFNNKKGKKLLSLDVDTIPKSDSTNLISSGAVYKKLDEVKDYIDKGGSGILSSEIQNKKIYITGTDVNTTNVGDMYFDSGVYLGEEPGQLIANKFTGNLNGEAETSAKLSNQFSIDIKGAAIASAKSTDGTTNISLDVTELDATKVKGLLPISCIPKAALERIEYVDNKEKRFQLSENDVQEGDTVKERDTGNMYLVVDISNLDNESGYEEYKAGIASVAGKLENARTINGIPFDGTQNITIYADPKEKEPDTNISGSINDITESGFYVITENNSENIDGLPEGITNASLQVINTGGTSSNNIQVLYTDQGIYVKSASDEQFYKIYSTANIPTLNDLGIGNIDNTSDLDKPISKAVQEQLDILNQKIEQVAQNNINARSTVDVGTNTNNNNLGYMWIDPND